MKKSKGKEAEKEEVNREKAKLGSADRKGKKL